MKPIVLAYYLPQFHEVEENNKWWGKGFTEWTNINASKSYFKNHKIRKPIEPLGQYDLLEGNIIEKQFEIANQYGIDGFLIWNYWFGNGEMLLEKPIQKILDDKMKVKYCLAWANHSWFNKSEGLLLKEQQYLGEKDYMDYFNYLLPHFQNDNYLKKDNKPIFTIFSPKDIPDLSVFIDTFNKQATSYGFKGIYWLAEGTNGKEDYARLFNNFYNSGKLLNFKRFKTLNYYMEVINRKTNNKFRLGPFTFDFNSLQDKYAKAKFYGKELPVIFSGWDSSIRHKDKGIILERFNLKSFEEHLKNVKRIAYEKSSPIIILKSWNEWAEGNLIEPDTIFNYELLKLLKKSLLNEQ